MLQTVKQHIMQDSIQSFKEFYIDYIIHIQQISIEEEIKFLSRHNDLNIERIDKLICLDIDKLVDMV